MVVILHGLGCRYMATSVISSGRPEDDASTTKAEQISKAMKAYLERARAHESFMEKEIHDYEIGKRHLAKIMGADPDNFTQEDIDQAIQYLLPSNLFDRKSRPLMKHPTKIIPQKIVAQFGADGRPFDPLFYTGFPRYYAQIHDLGMVFENLKKIETEMMVKKMQPEKELDLGGSHWINKQSVETMLAEELSPGQYNQLINLLDRIAEHPYAYKFHDVIFKFRTELAAQTSRLEIPELKVSEAGRLYQEATGGRKTAVAKVTVWDNGTGKVDINGKNLLDYFPYILDREQIMFPLQFTKKLGLVDFEAVITGGGHSSQAGALRLALANALRSFVERGMVEKMRLAGLLTRDPRMRERKKYGQEGARRKYT
ncbi:hypothetical protein LSH36_306g03085 [Paralvinella palmiformis]|uniref:Small ribosomal subunit protein uS9m n=1 Tax=Paralvinella palmiformis TaxID=53620 RepID=A0AAD9JIN0_9ANNE|nr:hypothetical protein LSH36_306g03085 [Paralvinella palmiformis]